MRDDFMLLFLFMFAVAYFAAGFFALLAGEVQDSLVWFIASLVMGVGYFAARGVESWES